MLVVSVKIGDHCYHGLFDMGASISAIPKTLYKEIMHDIAPIELEGIVALLSSQIEILSNHLVLSEMLKYCVAKSNTLLIS